MTNQANSKSWNKELFNYRRKRAAFKKNYRNRVRKMILLVKTKYPNLRVTWLMLMNKFRNYINKLKLRNLNIKS